MKSTPPNKVQPSKVESVINPQITKLVVLKPCNRAELSWKEVVCPVESPSSAQEVEVGLGTIVKGVYHIQMLRTRCVPEVVRSLLHS
jgi:hypothetical protein